MSAQNLRALDQFTADLRGDFGEPGVEKRGEPIQVG
jgi:hypothetical protein